MVIPYNASNNSKKDYLKDNFDFDFVNKNYVFKKDSNIIFTEIDFDSIIKAVNYFLYNEFPKLTKLMEYFKDITKIIIPFLPFF